MKNISTFDEIVYLKQSNFTFFKVNSDDSSLSSIMISKFINLPYQFIRSIILAIKQEYSQTTTQEIADNDSIWLLIMKVVGFFFSKYSVGCILVAFLLNKFILSSSMIIATSNSNHHANNRGIFSLSRLPNWIKPYLHMITILLLLIWGTPLIRIFEQKDSWLAGFTPTGDTLFLRFLLFILSYCIETVVAFSNNQLPLDSSDFSIFELSLQYYWLTRAYNEESNQLNSWTFSYMPDFALAMASRIVIHTVELFKIRKYRLLGSISINFIYLGYMGHILINKGINEIPIIIKMRNLPKVSYLFITFSSLVCYFLALVVRLGKLNDIDYGINKLHFYSFINNINHHLILSGEEDFTIAISKFAILVSSNHETKNLNYNRELQAIKVPLGFNNKIDLFLNYDSPNSPVDYIGKNYNNANSNLGLINLLLRPDQTGLDETYDNEDTFIIEDLSDNADTRESTVETSFDRLNIWNNLPTVKAIFGICKITWNFVARLISFKWLLKLRDETESIDTFDVKTLINNEQVQPTTDNGTLPKLDVTETLFHDDFIDLNEDEDPDYNIDTESSTFSGSDDNDDDNTEFIDQFEGANNDFTGASYIANDDSVSPISRSNDSYTVSDNIFSLISEVDNIGANNQKSSYKTWQFDILPIMNLHLIEDKRLTRSTYKDLISATEKMQNKSSLREHDLDTLCAVCKTNERNIILWPCKCFAICETCRISLALRDYKTCVCCRRNVEGFSRVYC